MERPRTRPIRSLLFVPGSDEKLLSQIPQQAADAVVIDMEEPQTPMTEAVRVRTRELVSEFFADADRHPAGHPLYFARLRPASSGHMLRDLQAIAQPGLAGILVPKIEGTRDIIAADALITNVEVEAGLARGSVLLYPILETAQAIRLAYEIAMASPRVGYMGGAVSRFGDIHQALGFRWTREGRETLFLRSKVLADAKAAGIRYPISGMWGGDVDDHEGLLAFGNELRELGYYGMMLGDERHVPLVHQIFTPTPEEVKYWKELVALAAAADAAGSEEAILHGDENQGEGHVIHLAHLGSSRLNLEWAEDLGVA